MLLIVLNIILSLIAPNKSNFDRQLDAYIEKSFVNYDSISYNLTDDLSEIASVSINSSRASNRIGSKFFVPVTYVDRYGISKERFLTVNLTLYQYVFVSKTPISKGEPIDYENSIKLLKDITDLNHEPFIEDELLGSVIAKYDLQPDNIICNAYLDALPILNVGDQVSLLYQVGSVQVSMIGTVRQAGAIGEVIKIRSSSQQYSAKIINSREALIIE
jgi:flagella basal body P-ring formation protein FlgA